MFETQTDRYILFIEGDQTKFKTFLVSLCTNSKAMGIL